MNLNRTIGHIILICCMTLSISTSAALAEDWFEEGVAHLMSNRINKAIEAFTRSLEMIPHDYEAYNNRGIAYSRIGKSAKAELDFSKALELHPKFYNARINRGIAREKQGAYAYALLDYLAAYQIKPESQHPQLLIAWLLVTCPDDRLRNGTLTLNIVQKLAGNRSGTKLLPFAAAAYAEIGDFKKAIAFQENYLESIYTTQPDSPQVNRQEGYLDRYQSGNPLQNSTPLSQTLSNNECMAIMAQIKNAFKKSTPPTTSLIALTKKKRISVEGKPPEKEQAKSVENLIPKPVPLPIEKKRAPVAKKPVKKKLPKFTKKLPLKPVQLPSEENLRSAIQLSNIQRSSQDLPASVTFPYVLVIGSSLEAEKGFPLANKIRQEGYQVFTSWVTDPSDTKWYQIYLGWFPDKKSAAEASTLLKEKGFSSVLVRKAPYTLKLQLDSDYPTLESINKQLAQMHLIGYEIDNRLMVGAYKDNNLDDSIMVDQLSSVGLTYQVIER